MTGVPGAERDDDEFRPPLPPEDRVWRHPAEVAAGLRASSADAELSTLQTPLRHAVALAALGAVGGAMIVTGLFLTLGGAAAGVAPASVSTEVVAVQPMLPVPRMLPAAEWSAAVTSEVAPAVVHVTADGRSGSAVAFKSDGYLLTSADLVGDATEVVVSVGAERLPARVLGTDTISGLSVVEVDDREFPAAPLALFNAPEVGEPAVTVPAGADPADLEMGTLTSTTGRIRVASDRSLHGVLELDVALPDDATGGALVDATGAVIGIVVDAGSRTATHAVPVAWARKIADDIMVWGEGRHTWIGITGIDLGADERTRFGLDAGGIRVETVIAEGPAATAGIRRGDLLTRLGDTPLASMSDLILELRRQPVGGSLTLGYQRDGAPETTTVTLGVRTDDTN